MEYNNSYNKTPTKVSFTNVQISSLVLYSILLCVGSTGNIVIVLRVVADRKLRSPTFIVISGLAAADFLFLGCRIPLEILHMLNVNWVYGRNLCKISFFIYQTASYSAAYHLVLLATVRYYLLVHPIPASIHLTARKSTMATLGVWVVAATLLSPVAFTSDLISVVYGEAEYTYCTVNPSDPHSMKTFVICYSAFSYLLPLVLIITLHCLKARAVAHALQNVGQNKRQLSSIVVVVILMFGILLLPVHVKNMVAVFIRVPQNTPLQATDLFFRCLAYSNSCINPFVYAFLSVQFRKSLKRMSRCSKSSNAFELTSNRYTEQTVSTVFNRSFTSSVSNITSSSTVV